MPTPSTLNELYEYRIVNIIRKFLSQEGLEATSGEDLEIFLDRYSHKFVSLILDDIQEYIGFDELLRQVKDS